MDNVVTITPPEGAVNSASSGLELPLQAASWDIWDKKYRLKSKDGQVVDETVDDTARRVAHALAEVEAAADRRHWEHAFLWALRHGAIPAGRIVSNAGAWEFKPKTSLINCTVSRTIRDSMDNILGAVHEAGLTLKAGSGIGYCFSTLRPKGAYVAGAGASTSGPLSFMDIFDKTCATVASAGGRRGAQMATFDVQHPDVEDFIRAKREDGRLRQFNLSLLITQDFIHAVETDADWNLVFPVLASEKEEIDFTDPAKVIWRDWANVEEGYTVREDGKVACKVYRTIRAKKLWNLIMASTYDYAEPGFLLIDRANQENNNWWCENIQASNPCVTADTWVHTSEGPRQVRDLTGKPFKAIVGGVEFDTGPAGFFRTGHREVFKLQMREGYGMRLTGDHKVLVSRNGVGLRPEWREAATLQAGDKVVVHNHRGHTEWHGSYNWNQGYLMGLLVGDGYIHAHLGGILCVWKEKAAVGSNAVSGADSILATAVDAMEAEFDLGPSWKRGCDIAPRREHRMTSLGLGKLAAEFGLGAGNKRICCEFERTSSAFHRGFLRGMFDADGSVQGTQKKGVSVRLAQSDLGGLKVVQRMLLRLGVTSTIYQRRPAMLRMLPDGHGGSKSYQCQADYEIAISGESLREFAEQVGFADSTKQSHLESALSAYKRHLNRDSFTATVESVLSDGSEDVYDVQVPGVNAFDANGIYVHNCGEQLLPPAGACLLGSVNLTCFVRDAFTPKAAFDWETYRKVVRIFTRMLDNVVEVNGLPLQSQRDEIASKRRHGMGFLGLGSSLAMLRMAYGSPEGVAFTERVTKEMALEGWRVALDLAKEKGPAPIMLQEFEVTPAMLAKRPDMATLGWKVGDKVRGSLLHARFSRYMQRIAEADPELVRELGEVGARFTHHTSIAPTGTIALSIGNNASNGIEPSFAHRYSRNVIRPGKKTKEKVDVVSYELLAYRALIDAEANPDAKEGDHKLPDYFVAADTVTPSQHVETQAAAQKWVDSSISKTINVATDIPFEAFQSIYLYAASMGLKGCTTFRFNPDAFQGVLVKDKDLANTTYRFHLEDGSVIEAKGNDEVEYDGEIHTAANLFDALKEGYYGKF